LDAQGAAVLEFCRAEWRTISEMHEQSGGPKKRFESDTVLPCLNAAS
jgi:hypothetical protein